MQLVVADTGPINYLILTGYIEVLPLMFARVVLPDAVQAELSHADAPPTVQRWMTNPPRWLEILESRNPVAGVHKGEAAAISLASSLAADLLLMDDRRGVKAAERYGLLITGTLGVLDLAAERGLIAFAEAIDRLERTNFRRPTALLESLLKKHQ